ncbi:hypothetical protein TYRP_002975 [Tyrophagus putrescentiae]|nr:hypothetical protein TYRP_002975 [Tyrophagus putrescentiae]
MAFAGLLDFVNNFFRGTGQQGAQNRRPNGERNRRPNGGRNRRPNGGRNRRPNGGRNRRPNGGRNRRPNGGRNRRRTNSKPPCCRSPRVEICRCNQLNCYCLRSTARVGNSPHKLRPLKGKGKGKGKQS